MQSEITDKIISYFTKQSEVAAVYLFGSYAKGKDRKYSDIDLGILLQREYAINEDELHRLYMVDLSGLLRKDIHLIFMNCAGEGILFQIFKYGKCIANNDPDVLTRFKMIRHSMIADFAYYKNMMQKSFIKHVYGGNQ